MILIISSIVNLGYQDNFESVYYLFIFLRKDLACTKTLISKNEPTKQN